MLTIARQRSEIREINCCTATVRLTIYLYKIRCVDKRQQAVHDQALFNCSSLCLAPHKHSSLSWQIYKPVKTMSLLHAPVANFLNSAMLPEPGATDETFLLSTLVYQSTPVKKFTEIELKKLLDHACARNRENLITGLLVYDHGCFFQWLEGPSAAVAKLWKSIQSDPRHGEVKILGEKSIARRLFSDWDMRLAWAEDPAHVVIAASVEVPDAMLNRLRLNPSQDNPAWNEFAALEGLGKNVVIPADHAYANATFGSAEMAPIQTEPSYDLIGEVVASELIPRLLMAHRAVASDGYEGGRGASARHTSPAEINDSSDVIEEFTQRVLSTDAAAAGDYLDLLHEKGLSIESIFLHVLQPVARRLGELCNEDVCHDVEVTVGMWRLQSLVRDLSAAFQAEAAPVASTRSVLVATQPGEPHMLGMRLDAEFFWRAGWDVVCEFPATDGELENLVKEQWFDVLNLSLSSAFQRDHRLAAMTSTIHFARSASFNPNLRVIVCGRVFLEHPEYSLLVGADAGCSTAAKVVSRAESRLASLDSPALSSARDAVKQVARHVASLTFIAPT